MNIFKTIQRSVNETFGYDCTAVVNINIYPLTNENGVSIKVDIYNINASGTSQKTNSFHLSAQSLEELPKAIELYIIKK